MMKTIRPLLLWGATLGAVALAVLSIVGAFQGTPKARVLFNSTPLVVFWFAVIALLAASLIFSRKVLLRPASLAMHLGVILILGGAMWGSESGHLLANKLFHTHKIPSGLMAINKGESSDQVYFGAKGEEKAFTLPFRLQLRDFWIDYYPSKEPWQLLAEVLADSSDTQGKPTVGPDGKPLYHDLKLDWEIGREITLPRTSTRVTVLESLASGREVYAGGQLEILPTDGQALTLPAVVGQETELAKPQVKIYVLRVFSRLVAHPATAGGKMEVADEPGGGPRNPAVQIELTFPDGAKRQRYVFSDPRLAMGKEPGLDFRYIAPELMGIVADPSSGRPALKLSLRRGDGPAVETYLAPEKGAPWAGFLARDILGPSENQQDNNCGLLLVESKGPVRCYNSDIAVIEGGRVAASQVVQVNHPLVYGGYHFYQSSYDEAHQKYTVLHVTSDSGLWAVWAGFALLCFGAFRHCWGRPVAEWLRKRGVHDN